MSREQDDVVRAWSESAPFWEKHRDTVRRMFTPITRALVEESDINEGMTVLDVACGSGEPGLTLAEIVGPRGTVTCTDIVPQMVASAEKAALQHRLTNMKFLRASADALPFPNDTFDAAVCRFGAMFFPDPLAGLRQMLRVTRPGGKVAFAVWYNSESNPFFHIVTDVLSRFVESPPEGPDTPGAFRFAERGAFARILEQAEAADVRERILDFHVAAPISPEEFWTVRSEMSDSVREKLAKIEKTNHSKIRQEVIDAARPFFPDGQANFPAKAIIVSGTKAAGNQNS